jgi:hypothetical protein
VDFGTTIVPVAAVIFVISVIAVIMGDGFTRAVI